MYILSKKPKESDHEALQTDVSLIERILKESGIEGLAVNSRIINVFKKKISLLHSAFKKAAKKGGRHLGELTDSWKRKNYSFKVYYHELNINAVIKEKEVLQAQKRKLETSLGNEQAKRLKIQEKIDKALEGQKKVKKYHQDKFKALARRVAKLQKKGRRGATSKRHSQTIQPDTKQE